MTGIARREDARGWTPSRRLRDRDGLVDHHSFTKRASGASRVLEEEASASPCGPRPTGLVRAVAASSAGRGLFSRRVSPGNMDALIKTLHANKKGDANGPDSPGGPHRALRGHDTGPSCRYAHRAREAFPGVPCSPAA